MSYWCPTIDFIPLEEASEKLLHGGDRLNGQFKYDLVGSGKQKEFYVTKTWTVREITRDTMFKMSEASEDGRNGDESLLRSVAYNYYQTIIPNTSPEIQAQLYAKSLLLLHYHNPMPMRQVYKDGAKTKSNKKSY
jgi:hypothetical protein